MAGYFKYVLSPPDYHSPKSICIVTKREISPDGTNCLEPQSVEHRTVLCIRPWRLVLSPETPTAPAKPTEGRRFECISRTIGYDHDAARLRCGRAHTLFRGRNITKIRNKSTQAFNWCLFRPCSPSKSTAAVHRLFGVRETLLPPSHIQPLSDNAITDLGQAQLHALFSKQLTKLNRSYCIITQCPTPQTSLASD